MPAESLRFDAVTKRFGDTLAVDGVSLDIPAGSFVALVGASGSGKSTLLQMINRLIDPGAGRMLLDGADIAAGPAPALRRRIGYVFQGIGLFPHMTVGENIGIGPRIAGEPPADVAALLELVALPPAIADRLPDALSGGQRQRVAIARALAPGAKLLLLDEAFGALDPVTRDALGSEIRRLHERLGLTTILVTHDMAEALLLADRVLVMAAGRIVADATPTTLLNGGGGEAAQALVAVPRHQTERLHALANGAAA
ncbi:ATP-binding cassette domain-containing protein [Sphingomonas sp. CD22]|uniref:ATP-binding cassette domain-containing protein n=1 Tax=Sphingomonas sp. CD22 TaxID=3100214 RepID=UPI002AE0984D|nr:ATP-binding cassette domain-containing protein [Sphingomonas sp. CD22]MEA1083319.1 ATP-binding cassette domain-containing protein [Sphingomonas sp. CD22]